MNRTAKDLDKERLASENKKKIKDKKKQQRKVKKTTIQTLPYEKFISNSVMLLRSNVRIGKESANLYSKTYLVDDINYHSLSEHDQTEKLQLFVDFLNGFDSSVSVQISLVNTEINKEHFKDQLLLPDAADDYNDLRHELNEVIEEKVMNGQNGLRCERYITVTVIATDFDTASSKFFSLEMHMTTAMEILGTKYKLQTANERVRVLTNIFRGVDIELPDFSMKDFDLETEKQECCPDYFEFKRDYFMFNDKFARCIYFRDFSHSILDTIYKDILAMNMNMIITENLDFVEKSEAETLIRRKITDMKQEEINKTRKAASAANGGFVDPVAGTQLERDEAHAQEFLEDIQNRGQKMIRAQFLIMLTANSYEELKKNTETLKIILRRYQINIINAPFRQEIALASLLPIGNSCGFDKTNNIQVRRTLSSESVAGFMPFNAIELLHHGGIFYGINQMSKNVIFFDKNRLDNPNAFIFGIPGSGKSVIAKLEMLFSSLATTDEIIILDPEREYTPLVQALGGEVIYISATSSSHVNPLDLTENPDPSDHEYDPVKSKLDFLLSFFSTIIGNKEISPIQKTIIDEVMHTTYEKHKEPTLKEYYEILSDYEKKASDEIKKDATYLRQALQLYVTGSMNVFANKSNVDIHNRIVVYDLKGLDKSMRTLGMMIVLENIWDKLAKNRIKKLRTRIYVDEMYLMFKSEHSSNFFFELYKRARKWGGMPTGITQNVGDVLRSQNAQDMLNSTQFVIMLSQNTNDREKLAHLLTIPLDTMRYCTNAKKGTGLLHAMGYGDVPFDNTFPENTKIYKMITTKFGEDLDEQTVS